jgi:hypothetical protein
LINKLVDTSIVVIVIKMESKDNYDECVEGSDCDECCESSNNLIDSGSLSHNYPIDSTTLSRYSSLLSYKRYDLVDSVELSESTTMILK